MQATACVVMLSTLLYSLRVLRWANSCFSAFQVDSPPALLHAQQTQLAADAERAEETVPSTGPALGEPAGTVLTLDIADGPHAHRRLLLSAPSLWTPAAANRRMLPEQHNATWGLDLLDQGHLPLDTIYNYTYNGTQLPHSQPAHNTDASGLTTTCLQKLDGLPACMLPNYDWTQL